MKLTLIVRGSLVLLVSLVSLGMTSCGGSSGESSGLPPATLIGSLNATQAGVFCDFTNGQQGGYGRTMTCPDGSTQDTDPDKATCVSAVPLVGIFCPTLTVGDGEGCSSAIGTDLCKITTAAACAKVNACLQ
jgi:hypothetical protein